MSAFYNECDPVAAAWLRELMADGLIPKGVVDERSITEVRASDLEGFVQCHFFAGIGGWPLALRLAGWHDGRPCWTGSCPCQPYSAAGKQLGNADERNLWPEFARLIRECRPERVFGEQVEGAIRHGWLDGVCADLEAEGYAVGSVVLGAHSVGSPHIRQRLFWVADAERDPGRARRVGVQPGSRDASARARASTQLGRCRNAGRMADADGGLTGHRGLQRGGEHGQQPQDGGVGERVGDADGRRLGQGDAVPRLAATGSGVPVPSSPAGLEHTTGDGRGQGRAGADGRSVASGCGLGGLVYPGRTATSGVDWSDSRIIVCRDGKARRIPTQPSLFPLAHGVSGRVAVVRPGVEGEPAIQAEGDVRHVSRVAALRGAGNAIVPEAAAAFIQAYLEVI